MTQQLWHQHLFLVYVAFELIYILEASLVYRSNKKETIQKSFI